MYDEPTQVGRAWPVRAGCTVWVLLLEDRSLEMVTKGRLWSDFRGRITYGLADLRGDAFGGVTAGALLLPLAMGYGIISGLGPVAGLYGAIAVCLFAAVFGGTCGMIAGPNTFATVTTAVVVAEYADNLTAALTTAMLAGLILVAFGVLRLGRYVSYVPYSLLSGFFTALGILIMVTQILPALGAPQVGSGVMGSVRAWPDAVAHVNLHALAVAGISLGVTVFWPRRLARFAPAQFMALLLATLAGMLVFRDAPVIGAIPFELPTLHLPVLSIALLVRLLQPALIIALLVSVGTLATSLQIDAITGTHHQPNRELVSHGIGNLVAGAIGGVPGGVNTGATMANVGNGGRSQVAGVLASIVLLLLVVAVRPVAAGIPYAALSGILIVIGWNFMDRRFIARMHRIPRAYVFVTLLTVLLALFVKFVDAMLIGLIAAAFIGARRAEGHELGRLVSVPLLDRAILGDENIDDGTDPFEARTGLVVFPDRVSVASARELTRIVIFDLSRTIYMDDTTAVIIGQLVDTAMTRSTRRFVIAGLQGDVADSLGDSWTPSSASSLQRIGGVDVSVRCSGVLRLIDILSDSPNSRYVKPIQTRGIPAADPRRARYASSPDLGRRPALRAAPGPAPGTRRT